MWHICLVIAYKKNRHFSSSIQLATSLGTGFTSRKKHKVPLFRTGSGISIHFHSGYGTDWMPDSPAFPHLQKL
jgi:hypothetical protein